MQPTRFRDYKKSIYLSFLTIYDIHSRLKLIETCSIGTHISATL